MQVSEQLNRWVGVGVFGAALGLYFKTMAPTVSFWDCGEFIAASYTLGVPHPPGSPLYILLGRLFSLAPIGEVAARVNFMSVLASALAVWCVFLSTLVLARRALGGAGRALLGDGRDWAVLGGALVAAGALAASYTFWYNASEAEVYGYSLLFVCLGVWLVLYWESGPMGAGQDRWLFLLAYVFGLGGGLHLLCLLTIPALLIWAWFADEGLRRPMVYLSGAGLWAMVVVTVMGPTTGGYLIVGVSLAGLLYHLYRRDRRGFGLVLGLGLLFLLGYSTYGALFIRSGLDPVIDENDPETWEAFVKFLNREQYGTDSQLLGMFSARADRAYQFWHLQTKYFLQQFPFPFLEIPTDFLKFRRATDASPHPVAVSVLPYLLGLGGLLWHAGRDRRRFFGVLALFVIMGFGLSLYLNMTDPQPRERHYVFGGMFFAFALWMGLGWTGLVVWLGQRLPSRGVVAAVAVLGLIWPVGMVAKLYHEQDRSGDYIAYDYAYNMLQSCDEGAILFTNGDNDTFPLWFLQEVEGIRRDVKVVNLSLLNTNWYIKQMRDREPKIDLGLTDDFIDRILTGHTREALSARYMEGPQPFKIAGIEWEFGPLPGHNLLRIQDFMVIKILQRTNWKKPIYFAITVPTENQVGLSNYLQLSGMAFRLAPQIDAPLDREELRRKITQVFQWRGITDPEVYKNRRTQGLLANYRVSFYHVVSLFEDDGEALADLMGWAEDHLFDGWEHFYSASLQLRRAGQLAMAADFTEKVGLQLLANYGQNEEATYENIVVVGDNLLEWYKDNERASYFYRACIELDPSKPNAYQGLAAVMQRQGQAAEALDMLTVYLDQYGQRDLIIKAKRKLETALKQEAAQP
ncbi:MAG: DUF2723 domain-containing protein [Candidatus Latescibacteria bacterium]|nr:DUF2723 domain-containing protein [Candidatus Latescibacterota bacterium]